MNWFLLSFSSTVLWGSTNFIDKYLISKYFQKRGISVLLIFSSLIGLFLLPIIFLINRDVVNIPLHDIFILIASGVIYVFAIFPYLLALREEDTSLVVPTFQAIPVFSYFLALLFLNEKLVVWQIIASLLIIFGAIGMSVDFKAKKRFFYSCILFLRHHRRRAHDSHAERRQGFRRHDPPVVLLRPRHGRAVHLGRGRPELVLHRGRRARIHADLRQGP